MRLRGDSRALLGGRIAAALVLLCAVSSLVHAAGRKRSVVARGDGVWLPSYDDNGVLQSQILGDSMLMVDDKIKVTGLRMETLTNDTVDVRITCDKCTYLPQARQITSSRSVRLERTNMVMTGTGFVWREARAQVRILRDVRVQVHDIERILSDPESAVAGHPATNEAVETTMTAKQLIFAYESRIGFFDGNVLATDGSMAVSSDSMMVVFNQDNTVQSLDAEGGVTITQGGMTSKCDMAHCNIDGEQILLSGNAEVVRGDEIARGDRIVLLRKQDRVICQPGYLKVGSFEDIEDLVEVDDKHRGGAVER